MNKIAYVKKDCCDGSPACPSQRICPVNAISKEGTGTLAKMGFGTAVVDTEKCIGCRKCVLFCPRGVISMVNK